jgi:hypothetical protein
VPEQVARRPVFTFGGRTFAWADVVAAARLDGSWAELEQSALRGLAALRRADAAGERPARDEILEAANRFRYDRNLLAGEELNDWLDHWQLSVADWRAHVERELARGRFPNEEAVADGEIATAVWADAVCSGALAELAERGASERALELAGGAEHVTEDAIARELELHGLEWLRLEGQTLTVPLEDTAREAALSVRHDGRSLEEVARDCGTEAAPLSVYAGDLGPDLSSALVAAREGDLVGPLSHADGFALVLVERKTPPAPDDPAARDRAVARIRRRAVERALLEYVEWHERL